jgi:hypothetical protein
MGKKELATLIDAYADAKASGNKYLVQNMIEQLQQALDEVCGPDAPPSILAAEEEGSEEQSLEY